MHVMSQIFRLAFLLRAVLPKGASLLAITGTDEHSMPFAFPSTNSGREPSEWSRHRAE